MFLPTLTNVSYLNPLSSFTWGRGGDSTLKSTRVSYKSNMSSTFSRSITLLARVYSLCVTTVPRTSRGYDKRVVMPLGCYRFVDWNTTQPSKRVKGPQYNRIRKVPSLVQLKPFSFCSHVNFEWKVDVRGTWCSLVNDFIGTRIPCWPSVTTFIELNVIGYLRKKKKIDSNQINENIEGLKQTFIGDLRSDRT